MRRQDLGGEKFSESQEQHRGGGTGSGSLICRQRKEKKEEVYVKRGTGGGSNVHQDGKKEILSGNRKRRMSRAQKKNSSCVKGLEKASISEKRRERKTPRQKLWQGGRRSHGR